jgi:exosome complex RNA-binding protein Rrp42 (RNase PH superfamily)
MSVLLGASEAHVYRQGIAANKRVDGRTRIQRRCERVRTQPLPQAIGSARVLRGATHILTAVYARLIQDTSPRFSIHVNG